MNYELTVIIPEQRVIEIVYIIPCVICDSDERVVVSNNDTSPIKLNSSVLCQKCGNQAISSNTKQAIENWNSENDLDALISVKEVELDRLIEEIKQLNQRRAKKKLYKAEVLNDNAKQIKSE